MRKVIIIGLAVSAFALNGCGSHSTGQAKQAQPPTPSCSPGTEPMVQDEQAGCIPSSPSASPGQRSGDVTTANGKFVQYPDGFRITFVSAQKVTAAAVEKQNGPSAGPKAASFIAPGSSIPGPRSSVVTVIVILRDPLHPRPKESPIGTEESRGLCSRQCSRRQTI